jgi:hypothetical protein
VKARRAIKNSSCGPGEKCDDLKHGDRDKMMISDWNQDTLEHKAKNICLYI